MAGIPLHCVHTACKTIPLKYKIVQMPLLHRGWVGGGIHQVCMDGDKMLPLPMYTAFSTFSSTRQ